MDTGTLIGAFVGVLAVLGGVASWLYSALSTLRENSQGALDALRLKMSEEHDKLHRRITEGLEGRGSIQAELSAVQARVEGLMAKDSELVEEIKELRREQREQHRDLNNQLQQLLGQFQRINFDAIVKDK